MKKKDVISLIRYHVEKNESGFRNEAYEIAKDFEESGDTNLASYIMSLLSDANTFIPQSEPESDYNYLEPIPSSNDMLILPEPVLNDVLGAVHAIGHNMGINKFLFQGAPGTGKTEAVKQLARILDRQIYMVDFSLIIDSKLGQTQKNLKELFDEMNSFYAPEKSLILFDEIDAIALDRTNPNDLREMGRVTSTMLKYLERVQENIVLVATTNLFNNLDKALIRRFDSVIDFNRYTRQDLLEIAEKLLNTYLKKIKLANRDVRLFRKIMELYEVMPYPGDLKNIIRSSVAFSDPEDGTDYFRRLYTAVTGRTPEDIQILNNESFTLREIEILTKKSKSSVQRELKETN